MVSSNNEHLTPPCPEIIINFSSPRESVNTVKPQKRLQSPTKSNCSGASTCRICHEGDFGETLISPCQCTGTVALVHRICLETWLSTSNTDQCEICKYNFRTNREKRTFKEWLNSDRSLTGPNGFYGDIMCILFLTPLCFMSVYFCAAGAIAYFRKGQWEGIGLAVISLTVLLGYVLWFYITVKFHLRCLSAWRESNPVIHLASPGCDSA